MSAEEFVFKCRWYIDIFPNFRLCGISYDFSGILTEVAIERKICKGLYWNLRKNWWKMSMIVTSFSNDESVCHSTRLKAGLPDAFSLTMSTNFRRAILIKSNCKRLLLFYKKVYFKSMLWNMHMIRVYSRSLLGATIAPNLVPWVLKKSFY